MSKLTTKEKKEFTINNVKDCMKKHDCFYVINISNIDVAKSILFRRICKKSGILVKVVKNSLITIALNDLCLSDADKKNINEKWLKGISAMLFINENYSIPGKIIKKFRVDTFDGLSLKFAYVAGELYSGEDGLNCLCSMKTLSELLCDIASAISSYPVGLAGALNSYTNLISAIANKK